MMPSAARKWFDRIKRQFGYYPGALEEWSRFPWSATLEPKPRHAPIPLPELRQRITDQVAAALKPRGFERPSRRFETWVRRRTPCLYDLASVRFVSSEPSMGMIQVGADAGLHLPIVEKIYHRFSGGIYRVQFGTAGVMLHLAYRKQKLPTAWFFWATAYSEKATQMIVDQIVEYSLPLLEQVADYESLLVHPFLRMSSAQKAILLALVGRTEEAQRVLELTIEEDEKVRTSHKGSEPLETFPEQRARIGILEALRSGQFSELVEEVAASIKVSPPSMRGTGHV